MKQLITILLLALSITFVACGNEADNLGVGAQCSNDDDCLDDQKCLLGFKGGYCGIENCTQDTNCPEFSKCVTHDDGKNYCFRTCLEKAECNANRDVDFESNCSSSVTFTDGKGKEKACVPPS